MANERIKTCTGTVWGANVTTHTASRSFASNRLVNNFVRRRYYGLGFLRLIVIYILSLIQRQIINVRIQEKIYSLFKRTLFNIHRPFHWIQSLLRKLFQGT